MEVMHQKNINDEKSMTNFNLSTINQVDHTGGNKHLLLLFNYFSNMLITVNLLLRISMVRSTYQYTFIKR